MIPFPNKKYGVILADPPWKFKTFSAKGITAKGAESHYSCMPINDIKTLPVSDIADKDCFLFMWATFPMLPEALETMSAWGFKYKTGASWHKKTKNGKTAFGTRYIFRCAAELLLVGTRGHPKTLNKSTRNVLQGVVREHSRKPDEQYSLIESLCGGERIELFARQHRAGWDCWGNETEKFTPSLTDKTARTL